MPMSAGFALRNQLQVTAEKADEVLRQYRIRMEKNATSTEIKDLKKLHKEFAVDVVGGYFNKCADLLVDSETVDLLNLSKPKPIRVSSYVIEEITQNVEKIELETTAEKPTVME